MFAEIHKSSEVYCSAYKSLPFPTKKAAKTPPPPNNFGSLRY